MESAKILVVDDHVLFRRGLVKLLSEQEGLEVVGEATDGISALQKTRELMPDIVLMDITMPRCDGLEATRRIKGEMPYVRIVILTVSEHDEDIFEAIKNGAQGYLLKSLEPEDLFSLLRGVQQGEAPISPRVAARILKEFGPQATHQETPEDSLTQREKEVLELVVRGASNKEVAAQLFISENTVKNHLRNILEKLHLKNRVQIVAYALQQGLVGQPPRHDPDQQNQSK